MPFECVRVRPHTLRAQLCVWMVQALELACVLVSTGSPPVGSTFISWLRNHFPTSAPLHAVAHWPCANLCG